MKQKKTYLTITSQWRAKQTKAAADSNDFTTRYHSTIELACDHKSFGFVRDVNVRVVIHGDEQLTKCKKHFTTVVNGILVKFRLL